MANREKTIRVGITIGDINGIGPEVVMKALDDQRILSDCTPIVYASSKVLAFHKKFLALEEFNYQSIRSADEATGSRVYVINLWKDEPEIKMGELTEIGGRCAFESLEAATQDLASGKIDVLVTAPISKEAMAKADFKFPGHTEYLADLSGQKEALMLMVAGPLRVGLATTHIPLNKVAESLSIEKIHSKIQEFNTSLRRDFGIRKPRLAILGLNPHAGENGKMGTEEQNIILPAINKAKAEGIMCFGPYPADGFFGSGALTQFDGIVSMYHDQGLTGFKALAFDQGVNYTAGLPVVRTSPDHGTAFDIAGKDMASANSMRQAIYLAVDIYRTRVFEKEINSDPLEISPPKERDKKEV
jgi:4-hydroxythreonine-4-phosphate dehydrogenase